MTTNLDSDENAPGWITAYCHSCWKQSILEHRIVKARLEDEAEKLSEEKSKNQSLYSQLLEERQKVKTNDDKIKVLEKERDQLKVEKKELERQNNAQKAEILLLPLQLNNMKNVVLQKEEEITILRNRISDLSSKSEAVKEELKKISIKYQELEEQKRNVKTISEVFPSLSIQMDSLLDLNYPHGWKITTENFENVMMKKMVTVAIIGMYDVGKSWFCNEFTGKKLCTSGSNQSTNSLDCHFPSEAGNLIGILDTPGSNEAIRCTQEDLIQKVEKAQGSEETNGTPDNQDKSTMHYKLLKNDARILQDLKEKFIREMADVLILICNKLSEKEQEIIPLFHQIDLPM